MYVIRRLGQGERALFTVVWVQVQVQVVLALMHYLFHVEVGHSATHTHLLRNRVHQFHASFFTSHFVIYNC